MERKQPRILLYITTLSILLQVELHIVFLQSSGDGWENLGDIEVEEVTMGVAGSDDHGLVDIVQSVGEHLQRFLVYNNLPSLIAADLPWQGKVVRVAGVIGTVPCGAEHTVDRQGYQSCRMYVKEQNQGKERNIL